MPDGEHVLPLGSAAVLREGGEVTLVALSRPSACAWGRPMLAAAGVSAEATTCAAGPAGRRRGAGSVARRDAVIVAENRAVGWGAAIAAILAEEAFADLDGPVLRVSGGNVPLPVAAPLEAEVSVSADGWSLRSAGYSASRSRPRSPDHTLTPDVIEIGRYCLGFR